MRAIFSTSSLVLSATLLLLGGCAPDGAIHAHADSPAGKQTSHRAAEQVLVAPPSVASFDGHRANYTVSQLNGTLTVTSAATGYAAVLAADTQRLQFSDGTLALDLEGKAGQLYRVYQAAFDRKPDSAGLAYWIGAADRGASMDAIASGFAGSAEFTALYGTQPTNDALLRLLYAHVLHREPDPAGLDYWRKAMDSGAVDVRQALLAFSESAENRQQVLPAIKDGIWLPSGQTLSVVLDGASAAATGQIVQVLIKGVPATGVGVTVDGKTVSASVIDGRVFFQLPESVTGSVVAHITASGQTASVSLTVSPTVLPAAPQAYLTSTLGILDSELAALQSNASDAAVIAAIRTELAKQMTAVASSTDAALRPLALAVAANTSVAAPLLISKTSSRQFTLAACNALADAYPATFSRAILSAGVVAAAFTAPPPANLFLGAAGLALMYKNVRTARDTVGKIVTECLTPFDLSLTRTGTANGAVRMRRANASAMLGAGSFVFNHNKPQAFLISETGTISDAIRDDLAVLSKRLAGLLAAVNKVTGIAGVDFSSQVSSFSAFTRVQQRSGQPSDYVLGTPSDARIAGTATASTVLSLNFQFKAGQMPAIATPFTFNLLRAADKSVAGSFSATLLPVMLPLAESQTIIAPLSRPVTAYMKATGADRFEIVRKPTRGTLQLRLTEGQFIYTSNGSGDDEFTFRAINDGGASNEATVTIKTNFLDALKAAAVGKWAVVMVDRLLGGAVTGEYTMTLRADGTGTNHYDFGDYPITWNVVFGSEGYYYLFDSTMPQQCCPFERTYMVEPLGYPITSFGMYDFYLPEYYVRNPNAIARRYTKLSQ